MEGPGAFQWTAALNGGLLAVRRRSGWEGQVQADKVWICVLTART